MPSFTDAQMTLGYDGFNSVYEWLIFTIEALNNQDDLFIILKGHPSFFSKGIEASVLQWDVLIWKEILKKYKIEI